MTHDDSPLSHKIVTEEPLTKSSTVVYEKPLFKNVLDTAFVTFNRAKPPRDVSPLVLDVKVPPR